MGDPEVMHFWGVELTVGKPLKLSLTQTELHVTGVVMVKGGAQAVVSASTGSLPKGVVFGAVGSQQPSALLDINFFPDDESVTLSLDSKDKNAVVSLTGTIAVYREGDAGDEEEEEDEDEDEEGKTYPPVDAQALEAEMDAETAAVKALKAASTKEAGAAKHPASKKGAASSVFVPQDEDEDEEDGEDEDDDEDGDGDDDDDDDDDAYDDDELEALLEGDDDEGEDEEEEEESKPAAASSKRSRVESEKPKAAAAATDAAAPAAKKAKAVAAAAAAAAPAAASAPAAKKAPGAADAKPTPQAKPAASAPAPASSPMAESDFKALPGSDGKVFFRDVVPGSGALARAGAKISVGYVGSLKSGKVFDKSNSFNFKLGAGEVIKGWDVGFAGMRVGGKRDLVIHADYAYGARGAPPSIPANATLKFSVTLNRA
jgi:FK506-binding nuclear protein